MPSQRDGAPPDAAQRAGIDRARLQELERGLEQSRSKSARDGAVSTGNVPSPAGRDTPSPPPAYHPDDDHQIIFALFGGSSRKGNWEPAAHIDCSAICGGVNIDLREADLLEGTTTIRCFALWGGINIIVPPDIDLDTSGTGILGGFDQVDHSAPDGDVPLVRIEGLALMGGVSIRVKERQKSKAKRPWRRQ